MSNPLAPTRKAPLWLVALIATQALCAVFFIADVFSDYTDNAKITFHLWIEAVASGLLVAAIAVESRYILDLLRRAAHLQRSASLAAKAMTAVVEAHFDEWRLSPAERDVANMLVKGLSISEIARIRGSAEGTVKSQLGAIYRKSGSSNRGELLSQIIDSVMEQDGLKA